MAFQFAFGPRIRKSPFFEATLKAGVTHFSSYNRVCFPVGYGNPMEEYRRLTEGVAIWDVSVERQIRFRGPDALTLLRTLTPRNLSKVVVGQGRYIPICDNRGTLINDPVLLPIAHDEYWISIADNDVMLWARAIAHERQLNVIVDEADVNPLAIQGPLAEKVAIDLFGDWVKDLKFFAFQNAMVGTNPVIVARSGWSRQGGFEIYLLDPARGTELWDAVMEAGKPYDMGPGAPNYIERIEGGLLSMGADTDDRSNPFEFRMERLVDVDQEQEFIGKKALARIKAEGPQRMWCGYFIHGERFPGSNQHRWVIRHEGREVGFASAGAYSPRLNSNIALGLIETDISRPGTAVVIETEHGTRDAEVTMIPFTIP
ncbi:MAG: glycine cleavage system protein T [Rhizobiales bacterium]|nr:glycine cleavage system protein T [Hyphomicrobiales bacterium]